MWLDQEIVNKMIPGELGETRKELEAAKKRHSDLLKKNDTLQQEKNKLIEKLDDNQLGMVTEKNSLNNLLEELKMQKKKNMNLMQHLEISKMHLEMLQDQMDIMSNKSIDSLAELKPIAEKLSFKWDVVDCLEKMLVGTRLDTAEQDALIEELQRREMELQFEIKTLKDLKPSTVSMWQEEFLDAKIKEADVILEFDKIKRTLALIKHDIEEKAMESEELIKFNMKDKYHQQLKSREESSVGNTIEFQNEVDRLKMQIKELEKIKEETTRQMYFNEETKIHLYEVRLSIHQRLQNTLSDLEKQINKNKKFEENINVELGQIQSNINDKLDEVTRLSERIQELQVKTDRLSVFNEELLSSWNESTVQDLEDEISILEQNVKILNETC